MDNVFTLHAGDVVAVSPELRALIEAAYNRRGKSVAVPSAAIKDSCANLSSKTTEEILEIRRHERNVSSHTMTFRFA